MMFNERRLRVLIGEAPDRTGQTVKQVSARMGEPDKGNYLARKLNPDDDGAHLNPVDLVYFLAATDLEPLDYLESCLGRVAFGLPNVMVTPEAAAGINAGQAAERFGAWLQKVAKAISPGGDGGARITPSEAAALIRVGDEIIREFAISRACLTAISRGRR